jgi:site-specific DNA-methyltransferase (adenine-specific)
MIEKLQNSIFLGDCVELFKNIPDESIDMTFADPPFNLNKKYTTHNDNLEFKKYIEWCEQWIFEMIRVTKPTGSIFIHNIPKWLTYYTPILNKYAIFKHWISWDAPTAPMGKSLQPAHYGILFYTKKTTNSKIYELRHQHKRDRFKGFLQKDYGGKKYLLHPFGPLISDVWTDIHRIKHNNKRDEHPCQLPIHLLDRLILLTTDENDIILDPFSGTGTTAIAAKRLGRRFIGFELDNEYKNISIQKINRTLPNSKIGDIWVSFYLNDILTIRHKDWENLEKYFYIPRDISDINKQKIVLINNSVLPNDNIYSNDFQNNECTDYKQLEIFNDEVVEVI